MRQTIILCDRCKKPIEYIGWTGVLREPKPKRLFITEIFNGNPSGYDYCDNNRELCADCMKSFKKWLKAETEAEDGNVD